MRAHPIAARWRWLSLSIAASMVVLSYLFISPAARASAAATTWNTFHDPIYGFTLSYPDTWMLVPEQNGSHITLLNPATGTTMSPIVTVETRTPADVLKGAVPSGAAQVHSRQVANAPAVDYVVPFIPGPLSDGHDAARAPSQTHSVILPIHNTVGTTNLYTFMLTQPTDATGKITAAEQAEQSTFEAMLDTFTLPASVAAVDPSGCPEVAGSPGSAVSPACSYPCTAVCWADANWRYTYYDDSSGSYSIYCNGGTYNNSYSANPQCSTGNQPGAQVPSANDQYWQPNFQCADFVSRALVENYQIAGLGNGGVSGQFPATSPNASGYSYQYYEFTYTPYSIDTTYDLIDVGVPGIPGLYDYLINSGLGTNIHQNIAAARPGDVLFLYKNGSISPSNRAHVVLITSTFQQSNGQWDALIDGHNVAVYHDDFQKNWIPYYGNNYEIIHMRGSLTGSSGQSTRYGSGWTNFTDGYGQSSSWVSTTNAQNATAWAQFSDSSEATPCAIAVYVPDGSATANLTFGVEMADGSWTYRTVNENNIDGWALLFKWGDLNATPTLINVGNNNGMTTQKIGVGAMAFLC